MAKREIPKAGSVYAHYKGNYYVIDTIARNATCPNDEERYEVIYHSVKDELSVDDTAPVVYWARDLDNFMEVVVRESAEKRKVKMLRFKKLFNSVADYVQYLSRRGIDV